MTWRDRAACRGCGRGPLVSARAWRYGGNRAGVLHYGRGLCRRCYDRAKRQGRLLDYERINRPRHELLEDLAVLTAEGYTRQQCAERLGVTRNSLDVALSRARRRNRKDTAA